MPIVNGPYRDDFDDDEPRHKPPKALRRLRKQFTYDKQMEKFCEIFGREPANDE